MVDFSLSDGSFVPDYNMDLSDGVLVEIKENCIDELIKELISESNA